MSEEWQNYLNDPRTICKYSSKCYQKNPDHHKKYKHPPRTPKRKNGDEDDHDQHKRMKAEAEEKTQNDGADLRTPVTIKVSNNDSNHNNKNQSTSKASPQTTPSPKPPNVQLPEQLTYHDTKDVKDLIKELFLVEMPDDFYKFFECLKSEENMEKTLSSVNLQLIGPYELMLGKLPVVDKELYLVHWRFFYDPPEFQAVLKSKGKSQLHIGYYRDDPNESPVFVARNDSSKDCQITPMSANLFGAVYSYLQHQKKSPFIAIACHKLMIKVQKWAESHNYSLEEYSMKKRQALTVTKTFHGAGITVPYNKKTKLGYRQLVESDANIKKMFAKLASATSQAEKDSILSELQPVLTYASIAVDECDFGTGLEMGINLFCSGLRELEPGALNNLCAVYGLLGRDTFSEIIQAHIKYRRKGPDMSLLSLGD